MHIKTQDDINNTVRKEIMNYFFMIQLSTVLKYGFDVLNTFNRSDDIMLIDT